MKKAVVLCSGGVDSVTLAWKVAAAGALDRLVSFDYGQRHSKEIERAALVAERLGARHDVANIRELARFLPSPALNAGGDTAGPATGRGSARARGGQCWKCLVARV